MQGSLPTGDLFAVFVALSTLALPLLFCELRRSTATLLVYWFVVALHQGVAVTNEFFFTTIGADADAKNFQAKATELVQLGGFDFAVGAQFYSNFLGGVYRVFGVSHLLGEELSILAFAASCVILLKILSLLRLSDFSSPVLFAFGALPTMVFFGSVILRESYQVLFFMLSVHFGISMHLAARTMPRVLALVVSAILLGLYHQGLIAYAPILIVLFMGVSLDETVGIGRLTRLRVILLGLVPVLILAVSTVARLEIEGLAVVKAIEAGESTDYASVYRLRSAMTTATYGAVLDTSSPFAFCKSSSLLYARYMLSPLPWEVRSVLDVYASLEAGLRVVLLACALHYWRRSCGPQRRMLSALLIVFFSMSFLWALGTTNYGTAMRHHMLTWWILVALGVPPLQVMLRQMLVRRRADATH